MDSSLSCEILSHSAQYHAWLRQFLFDCKKQGHIDYFLLFDKQFNRAPEVLDTLKMRPHFDFNQKDGMPPTLEPLADGAMTLSKKFRDFFVDFSNVETSLESKNLRVVLQDTPLMKGTTQDEEFGASDPSRYRYNDTVVDQLKREGYVFAPGHAIAPWSSIDHIASWTRLAGLTTVYQKSQTALAFLKSRLSPDLHRLLGNITAPMYGLFAVHIKFSTEKDKDTMLWKQMEAIKLEDYASMTDFFDEKFEYIRLLRRSDIHHTNRNLAYAVLKCLPEQFSLRAENWAANPRFLAKRKYILGSWPESNLEDVLREVEVCERRCSIDGPKSCTGPCLAGGSKD